MPDGHTGTKLIAIVGDSGAGKTSFISSVVGHGINGATRDIQPFDYERKDGQTVTLLDTPGFTGSSGNRESNTVQSILQMIQDYLLKKYDQETKLSGIIFLHRITSPVPPVGNWSSWRLLQNLCGNDKLTNVVVVTTHWDQISYGEVSFEDALKREDALKTRGLLKDLSEAGVSFRRTGHFGTGTGETLEGRYYRPVTLVEQLLGTPPIVQEEAAWATATGEIGVMVQGSGAYNGASGPDQDFERLQADLLSRCQAYEDYQQRSIATLLESIKAFQERDLKSLRSEMLEALSKLKIEAVPLRGTKSESQIAGTSRAGRDRLSEQTAEILSLREANAELKRASARSQAERDSLFGELGAVRAELAEVKAELNGRKPILAVKRSEEADTPGCTPDSVPTTNENKPAASPEEGSRGRTDSLDERVQETGIDVEMEESTTFLERRQRWQTLTWTSQTTYHVLGSGVADGCRMVGGTFFKRSTEGKLLMLRLPTAKHPEYTFITDSHFLNAQPNGFAYDASQELLMASGITSRLVWIAMYSPPSKSDKCKWILLVEPWDGHPPDTQKDQTIQICGDVVGLLIRDRGESRLLICRAKTKELIWISQDEPSFPNVYSFTLVSPTLFHVTVIDESESGSKIAVYSLDPSVATSQKRVKHIASLLLPPLTKGASIISVECHTEPLREDGSPRIHSQLTVLHIKFACADCEEASYLTRTEEYQLVLPTSTFIHYWKRAHSPGAVLPVVVPWEEWGPYKTRWVPCSPAPQSLFGVKRKAWTRHIHGPRILALPTGDRTLEVLDFDFDNPIPSPSGVVVSSNPNRNSFEQSIHTESTIIQAGPVFSQNVVSALPYRKTIKREALRDQDFAGYMVDEERIVGVSVRDSDQRVSKLTTLTF